MVLLEILGEVKRAGKRNDGARLASDRTLCTLCAGCVPLCPYDALTVHETYLVIDGQKCNACGSCVKVCPTGALKMEGAGREAQGARSEGAWLKEQGARASLCPPTSSRKDSTERDPQ